MKYNLFISYHHRTAGSFAKDLERALKSYAKPWLKPPIRIFRDENYLVPGVDLPQLIRNALDDSEFLLLLASRDAAGSTWVRDELVRWCGELGRTQSLLIVLLDGGIEYDANTKMIDWNKTDAIPSAIESYLDTVPYYIDMRTVLVEAKPSGESRLFHKAVNDITARIRGIDPGEMNDEAQVQHRKNMRLRDAALFVLASLSIATTAATIYANMKSLEATTQRDIANQKSSEAETERNNAVAERLITEAGVRIENDPYEAARLLVRALDIQSSSRAEIIARKWHDRRLRRILPTALPTKALSWEGHRLAHLYAWRKQEAAKLRVWDTDQWRVEYEYDISIVPHRLALAPDANRVALADLKGKIEVRSIEGEMLWEAEDSLSKRYNFIRWSIDGKLLIAGNQNGFLDFCDPTTEKITRTIDLGDDVVAGAPSQSGFACVLDKKTEIFRDYTDTAPLTLHIGGTAIAWTGRAFFVGDASGKIRRVRKIRGSEITRDLETTAVVSVLTAIGDSVSELEPFEDILAVGSVDGTLRFIDTGERDGKMLVPQIRGTGSIEAISWSADGKLIASGGHESQVRVFDPWRGDINYRTNAPQFEDYVHFAAKAQESDRYAFTMQKNPVLHVLDSTRGDRLSKCTGPSSEILTNDDAYNAVTWSHTQPVIVAANSQCLRSFRVEPNGSCMFQQQACVSSNGGYAELTWDKTGTKVFLAQQQRGVLEWDLKLPPVALSVPVEMTKAPVLVRDYASGVIGAIRDDGKHLDIWDPSAPGDVAHVVLPTHLDKPRPRTLRFRPERPHVAIGTNDDGIMLIELPTGKVVWQFVGTTDNIINLEWSTSGRFLATASSGGRVRVFDGENGTLVGDYHSDLTPFYVQWDTDDRRISVGGGRLSENRPGRIGIIDFLPLSEIRTEMAEYIKWYPLCQYRMRQRSPGI